LISSDKFTEKERFDKRARRKIELGCSEGLKLGSSSICPSLNSPYIFFERKINYYINIKMKVLEIGSGNGEYTYSLLKNKANVTATDISPNCLTIIEKKFKYYIKKRTLKTAIADMESLPFKNEAFDAVVIAGSLSYGNFEIITSEIKRVLKVNGIFLCVDSLNNNPIYRINRFFHFLRAKRSILTLNNMPTLSNIRLLNSKFKLCDVRYFGSISWLTPLIKVFFSKRKTGVFSDRFDKLVGVKRSAFKFVFIAKKENNNHIRT